MPCSRCGKCCEGIIVPFVAGGAFGHYLITHGAKIIDGIGTWIPSKCQHLQCIGDVYHCDIYEDRPNLCHADAIVSNFRQWKPEGCTNEV